MEPPVDPAEVKPRADVPVMTGRQTARAGLPELTSIVLAGTRCKGFPRRWYVVPPVALTNSRRIMVRIMALDPGGTTGYVVWESPGGPRTVSYGQLGPDPHHRNLWKLLLMQDDYMAGNLIVVCERFDNRGNVAAKLVSLEYIGIVNLYQQMVQEQNGRGTVVWQGSSIKPQSKTGKGWADDKKLEATGLMIKPKTTWRHANDASRHLLYYLCHGFFADPEMCRTQAHYLEMLKP